MTAVMVWCGVARPDGWIEILTGAAIAIVVAMALSLTVPNFHRWTAEKA
jgi:hypothetical protein